MPPKPADACPLARAATEASQTLAEVEAVLFLIRLRRLQRQHRLVLSRGPPEGFWLAAADAQAAGELSASQWAALSGPCRTLVLDPALRRGHEVALVLSGRAPFRVTGLLIWRVHSTAHGMPVQPLWQGVWNTHERDFVPCVTVGDPAPR